MQQRKPDLRMLSRLPARWKAPAAWLMLLLATLPAVSRAQTAETEAAAVLRSDSAARPRLITRATLYGAGFTNVFDTYLSPQEYTGVEVRISRESMRMTNRMHGNLSRQTFFQGNVGYTHNKVDNNNTLSALLNWNYGLHYHFRLADNFRLLTGGVGEVNGGFLYNMRNGNNPAQARAYVNLDASIMAIWQVRVARVPLTLRYQANLPVAGVMFSPQYGESYYEIFSLGNHKGIVHFTSLHNQPSLRQMLTADFPVGRVKMRFAYQWDAQQAEINDIRMHTYSHVFMVGLVKELYLFRNPKKNKTRKP